MANENTKRKTSKAALIGLISLGFGLAVFGLLYTPRSEQPNESLLGQEAPDFEFELAGKTRQGLVSLRGKVVLVNFWAYWCGPCLEEMPSLKKLETHFAGKDFVLLMVHVGDDREEVAKIAGLPSNLVMDIPASVLSSYGVSGLPHTVLIDKDGVIRGEFLGPRDWFTPDILKQIEEPLS